MQNVPSLLKVCKVVPSRFGKLILRRHREVTSKLIILPGLLMLLQHVKNVIYAFNINFHIIQTLHRRVLHVHF